MKDLVGQEIAVGDRVVVAVTRYRSAKLTLAKIETLLPSGEWGRVLVKTIPGNRRTSCYADEVLLAPLEGTDAT